MNSYFSFNKESIPFQKQKMKTFNYKEGEKYNKKTNIKNFILGPFQVQKKKLFLNPHCNLERIQVIRIQPKQKLRSMNEFQYIECHQFFNECKNGNYSALINLQFLSKKQVKKLNSIQPSETKVSIYVIGTNIIKINQLLEKQKIIKEHFQTKFQKQSKLTIRADFEGGNMAQYFKVNEKLYNIILNNDTNTRGYNQWFHFYLQKEFNQQTAKNQTINFIIINVSKAIYYMPGMKLLSKTNKSQQQNLNDWERNIQFYLFQSNLLREDGQKYFNLAFSLPQNSLEQGVFVALSHPYSYLRLDYLSAYLKDINSEFKIMNIGRSVLGNSILVYRMVRESRIKNRRNVIVLARQHSSQNSSSFIAEFIIKKLAQFYCYQKLNNQFNWHIVPIMNPDGVIHGNSRTNIKGYDINRCWSYQLMGRSSQVQCINYYLSQLKLQPDDILIDLHGHSRQFGCFSFFNTANQFSFIFNSKMNEFCNFYDLSKCRIGVDPSKRNTFRAQMGVRMKIKNVVTLQTSFYGFIDKQTNQLKDFGINDYENISIAILKTIQSFIDRENNNQISYQEQKIFINQQSDSDTDPQGDYLNQQQRNQIQQTIYQKRQKKFASNRPATSNSLSLQKETKKNKQRCVSQMAVLNIYQKSIKAKNSNNIKLFNKIYRPLSCVTKLQIQNKIKKERKNKYEYYEEKVSKIEEYKPQQINKSYDYYERNSFKILFASAQLRNFSSQHQTFRLKNMQEQKNKKNHIEKGKNPLSKQIVKSVRNISFPFKTDVNDEFEKKMKQIICQTNRIKTKNRALNLQVIKNKQKVQKQSVNQKIAQLCELAKKIDRVSALI